MASKDKKFTNLAIFVSVFLLLLLFVQWFNQSTAKTQVKLEFNSVQQSTAYIEKLEKERSKAYLKVPTGVLLNSLSFKNPHQVSVSGHIWQKFSPKLPKDFVKDFYLPESVGSEQKQKIYERTLADGSLLKGWKFSATVEQSFHYGKYPFDHKEFWLDIAPKSFNKNVILIPDFSSYKSGDLATKNFGLYEDIQLQGFELGNTFFTYYTAYYGSNLGIPNFFKNKDHPDFSFSLILKRKVFNILVIYILPVFLVLLLLYGIILMITSDAQKKTRINFSLNLVFSTCSALLFVLILSHGSLRKEFAGAPILYMEWFYILGYFLIVSVALSAYAFSEEKKSFLGKVLNYKDNYWAKIYFWPITLFVLNLITYFVLGS